LLARKVLGYAPAAKSRSGRCVDLGTMMNTEAAAGKFAELARRTPGHTSRAPAIAAASIKDGVQ
jgi:hypothetical protein